VAFNVIIFSLLSAAASHFWCLPVNLIIYIMDLPQWPPDFIGKDLTQRHKDAKLLFDI